jgi:type II pantothenate kinase
MIWDEKLVLDNDRGFKINHIGGTGIGGGTFLGLCKELLGETDISKLKKMFSKGDRHNVDLSVGEIIGSGIGIVSSQNTASNLGKLARNVNFKKEDLAAGIVNLIGQAIATNLIFAAKAFKIKNVVLIGKFTKIKEIMDIVKNLAKVYKIKIFIPKKAEFGTVIGSSIYY